MSKRRKTRSHRGQSKQIILDKPEGISLDLLLELYLSVVGDYDLDLDMKLDKIKLVLSGDKIKNEKISQNLLKLQGQLLRATRSDMSGMYHYEQSLFPHLFKTQVSTRLLKDGLTVLGYNCKLTEDKTLICELNIKQLISAQKQIQQTTIQLPNTENKDIQNFLALVNLRTQRTVDQIIEKGIDLGVLGEKDGKLFFASDRDISFEKLVEGLSSEPYVKLELESLEESEVDDFGFKGGKIVFINEGENIKQSSYYTDDEEEINQ